MTALLQLTDLSRRFGGIKAVRQVNLSVKKGEIAGLIGPNGAGKTTTFSMISGSMPCSAGRIKFGDKDITNLHIARVAELGLCRTFQHTAIFQNATVTENIRRGALARRTPRWRDSLLTWRNASTAEEQAFIEYLLSMLSLEHQRNRLGGVLPYGDQRKLGIAIALATRPHLLLLDEPAAGLNELEANELADCIRRVRDEMGITVLLVEHNLQMVMSLCDRIFVLDHGEMIASGTPAEISAHPDVIAAYIGSPVEITDA